MAAAVGSPDAHAGEVPVAYVQLKPGVAVTEQELIDFAAAHIPERAAIPKLVKIMPSLPVTGVGKIFKPALQQREIEAAVRSEAQNVGATIVDLAFERSPRLGQVVRVRAGEGTRLCAQLWSAMPSSSKWPQRCAALTRIWLATADVARCRQVSHRGRQATRGLSLRIVRCPLYMPDVYPRSIESSISIVLGCMRAHVLIKGDGERGYTSALAPGALDPGVSRWTRAPTYV